MGLESMLCVNIYFSAAACDIYSNVVVSKSQKQIAHQPTEQVASAVGLSSYYPYLDGRRHLIVGKPWGVRLESPVPCYWINLYSVEEIGRWPPPPRAGCLSILAFPRFAPGRRHLPVM